MKRLILSFITVGLVFVVSGCAGHNKKRSDNFFPYVVGQADSIPMAYGDEGWVYPAGTSSDTVIKSLKDANIVTSAKRKKGGVLEVTVGPNFYALAPTQQRGLAHTIGEVYGVGKDQKGSVYLLRDATTKRVVGSYTNYGLLLY